ncbi:hypothetical protein GDO81_011951 [Engystomops pustulosus]|uniref:MADF domain-containing protein n=1 Tax=Engystomops pustulosus TaxID=76066 RepID=A0AAV7BHS5_ENGPU|nr:hypothetical protein GDO81_011951 [Engystomops pustulosus]
MEIFKEIHTNWQTMDVIESKRLDADIRNRWRSMRDRFRKDHSMYEKSGSLPCKIKKYIHYDELLFLAPSRTLRKTHGNIPHAEPSTSQENVDHEHSSDDPMEENQEADMEGKSFTRILKMFCFRTGMKSYPKA